MANLQDITNDPDAPYICRESNLLVVHNFWSDELRRSEHHA